jgi:hypothetical protein
MTFLNDELDPYAAPFGAERDLPLTFQWRSEPRAIAALDLPPAPSPRHEDARNAVLTEAKLAAERGRWVSYSRRPAFYVGRNFYHGDSFRYATVPGAIDDAVRANLLEEERALRGSRGRQSRFRATPLLCTSLSGSTVQSHIHEVIWLRDHRRHLVRYAETALTRRLRNEVAAVNAAMSQIKVNAHRGVRRVGSHWVFSGAYVIHAAPRGRRIFNRGSFDMGGRFFGWWQGIPATDRANILLDGQPVLEPDFAQLHAQILYAVRDLPLTGDAYATGEFPRVFGKTAFNIALNARDRGCVSAIARELGIDRRAASKLLAAIRWKHRCVADAFCSDAGVHLMRIDSDIILAAVKQCQREGVPVLPVHDSVLAPARHAGRAAEIMVSAFSARFPRARCEVRIKNRHGRVEDSVIGQQADDVPMEKTV